MKNMVMFTAKDFARVISAGRKFMDKKKGTSFAAEICNQFIIEVIEEKEKNRIRAYLWASDGYRAARVEIPVFNAEGGSFVAAIHNPVFTPAAGTHVTIELGSVKKEMTANLIYHEYGVTFSTKQPKKGQKSAQEHLHTLKTALQSAIDKVPVMRQTANTRYMKEAMEAVLTCNANRRIPVSISMTAPLDPILLRGADIDAIVLPTRGSSCGKSDD